MKNIWIDVVGRENTKTERNRRHNKWKSKVKSKKYKRLRWILCFKQFFRCFYCKRYIFPPIKWFLFTVEKPWTATFEHKIRMVDGGSDKVENLCVSCKKCNNNKGSWDDEKRFSPMYNAMKDSGIIEE